MHNKAALAMATLCLVLSSSTLAFQPGSLWGHFTKEDKFRYVEGYGDAVQLALLQPKYFALLRTDMTGGNVAEVVNAVEAFYKEPQNHCVPLTVALVMVDLDRQGSGAGIDSLKKQLKRSACIRTTS